MNFVTVLEIFIALIAGFGIGWACLRRRPAPRAADGEPGISREEYDEIRHENTALTARLEAAIDARKEANAALDRLRGELTEARERVVIADNNRQHLDQRLKDQQQEVEKMREQLRLEFQNTGNTMLEAISAKFSTQSEKQIGDLLNPLRERIGEFQKMVGESFATQGKEQYSLKTEIEKIVLQADSLTKALRGDVKAQGNWGEVMLEKILEESGLRPGLDYVAQGAEMNLSGAEGNRLRPDYIVNLPGDKHIIIDSKVSITAYDRYCSEADDAAQENHLREFLRSVRSHVNNLEQKRYQDIDKLDTPECVLMFMPVEGAYSLALQQDREMHSYAWNKKVVIVCPTTLFVTLQTVAAVWRKENQDKNVEKISQQAGKLYDKFAGFIEDMQAIGDKLTGLQKSYDSAVGKLSSGRGNLVGSVEKLKELGAKTSKSLPKGYAEEETETLALTEG